jgi:hypothetical protein
MVWYPLSRRMRAAVLAAGMFGDLAGWRLRGYQINGSTSGVDRRFAGNRTFTAARWMIVDLC